MKRNGNGTRLTGPIDLHLNLSRIFLVYFGLGIQGTVNTKGIQRKLFHLRHEYRIPCTDLRQNDQSDQR